MRIKHTATLFGAVAAVLCHMTSVAQDQGSITVQAEIIPSVLSLSVSSNRLSFGQVTSDADTVRIDPANGNRYGNAFGNHSTGAVLLEGMQGVPYTVSVTPPHNLGARGVRQNVGYSVLLARSPECERTGFVQLSNPRNVHGTIGDTGCARLQIGGLLAVYGAPPGMYEGTMTVHISSN